MIFNNTVNIINNMIPKYLKWLRMKNINKSNEYNYINYERNNYETELKFLII